MKRILHFCRLACDQKFLMALLLLAFMAAGSMAKAATTSPDFLVEGGKARAVIVLGDNPDPFYRFVGEELQRYVKAITGAQLEIVTASQAGNRPEGGQGRRRWPASRPS